MDKDGLLDFITHPGWGHLMKELARLTRELEVIAARCPQEKHDFERGRLLGAERAALVLDNWREETKKELRKHG